PAWFRRWRRACVPSRAACHARTCSTAACHTPCCSRSSPPKASARWSCPQRRFRDGQRQSVEREMTLASRWDAVMMPNYGTPPIALDHGQGVRVWDVEGREYLDFVGGIAVSSLGHAHPAIVEAVSSQVARLVHTSNLAIHEPGVRLAEHLVELLALPARVFFANSGADANECALKLARLHGKGD